MAADDSCYEQRRNRMVGEQLVRRGITDTRVLDAMRVLPRHRFVPEHCREEAYDDTALPTMAGQTISQPYVVAFMTQALQIGADDVVLDIGTGSGYQAAVLACLARKVFSVEVVRELAEAARGRLLQIGVDNVEIHVGDGSAGLPAHAPYDGILVAAAAPRVPEPLLEQLSDRGRLILPIGSRMEQHLQLWRRTESGWRRQVLMPVRFVPLQGQWGWHQQSV